MAPAAALNPASNPVGVTAVARSSVSMSSLEFLNRIPSTVELLGVVIGNPVPNRAPASTRAPCDMVAGPVLIIPLLGVPAVKPMLVRLADKNRTPMGAVSSVDVVGSMRAYPSVKASLSTDIGDNDDVRMRYPACTDAIVGIAVLRVLPTNGR